MSDDVKNPPHYNRGKIEVWEYSRGNVEVWELNEDEKMDYYTVNAVKYIARAGFKDPSKEVEDLEKAIAFLERKIKVLNGTTGTIDTNSMIITFGDYAETLTANQRDFLERKFGMSVIMVSAAIEEYKKNNCRYLEKRCIQWFYRAMEYAKMIRDEESVQKIRDFYKELSELEILG